MTDGAVPGHSMELEVSERHRALAAQTELLPKHYYASDDHLRREVAQLFAGRWQFAAMADELPSHNDFVTLDLPGHAVVLQNFKGEIRAFQNVCTHRFNRIQTEERGRRPLMCGYHAWMFNESGFPVGRGKGNQFPVADEAARARLCLPAYRVDACGKFLFVDLSGSAPPLRDQLGTHAAMLDELSGHMGAQIHYAAVPHRANWKLLVENVLECYHCGTVHSESFVAGLGIGRLPIAEVSIDGPNSSCHFPRTEIRREGLRKKILSHLDARAFVHDSFFHVHIFPNLFISSQEGLTFYVGHAVPLGARETTLRTRIYEPAVELSEGKRARQDMLNVQSREVANTVLQEDRTVLENVQRGLELSDRPGVLGAEEVRIATFFQHYRALLDSWTPTAERDEVG